MSNYIADVTCPSPSTQAFGELAVGHLKSDSWDSELLGAPQLVL